MARPIVDDELWALIEPLLPPPKPRRLKYPGRKPVPDRAALTGILFVLRTGIRWRDLPAEMGCGSGVSCWRRLRDWQQAGVWPLMAQLLAEQLPDGRYIDFRRVAATAGPDTPVTRRPLPLRAKQPSAVAAEFGMTLPR